LASPLWPSISTSKVVAFIAIMMLVGRRLVPWIMSRSAATGSRELFTLSVLALALGLRRRGAV
jgi:CPA2 family monovalent cation:H+ antiporter-2